MSLTDLEAALSNSLSLSSIFILIALGLAITFGVMRVINMAHGDMMMLGAYTAYLVSDSHFLGLNLYWAIPICFLVVGFFGFLLEIGLIQFLYGRPLDTLLATWGVGMIIQNIVLIILGTDRQAMKLPDEFELFGVAWSLDGFVSVGRVNIERYRIFIVGVTLVAFTAVYLWLYWTSFGLKIRAVVQNRQMAAASGISTRWVDSLTFAIATGLAGVAGCMVAYLYGINYNMGNSYIVEAFMVVILGGTGRLSGSLVAAVLIGTSISFADKILRAPFLQDAAGYIGIAAGDWQRLAVQTAQSMSKIIVLLIVIGAILIRPQGLFTTKERAYD